MQLVFSNVGGALSEINLPFTSKEHPKSVVLPIEIDRELIEKSPRNEQFPLHPAKTFDGKMQEPVLGGYYPLIRRDLIGQGPIPSFIIKPEYYSLNIVSEYPEVAKLSYRVKSFSKNELVLEANQPHRRITKRFYFPEVCQSKARR